MGGTATKAVYIIDDHSGMRYTLRCFVDLEPQLRTCGDAPSAEKALEDLGQRAPGSKQWPDLLLVDVSLPGMSGIEFVRQVKDSYPDLACLMLSGHDKRVYVTRALQAGANGYVMKGMPDQILEGIHSVLEGNMFVSEQVGQS